jgi:hypothetical protein
VDFGGQVSSADGFSSKRMVRSGRLRDNFGDAVPALLRTVGFTEVTEVAHRISRLGRVTYYRGVRR